MFGKNTIISGLVSGAILATMPFATSASAGQVSLRLETGLEQFISNSLYNDETTPRAQYIQYNDVPIRKIRRNLRRRGLYPVSDYRLRGDFVILRAEDEDGTIFRVVADADYGDIVKIRRVRRSSNYRQQPVEPRYYDDGYDNYRPGYDRPVRRKNRGNGSTHAERKAAKDAAARAHAKRKAANRTHAQRKAAQARADTNRRAKQARADTARRARQAKADANRRAAQARADRNRRAGAKSAPIRKIPLKGGLFSTDGSGR